MEPSKDQANDPDASQPTAEQPRAVAAVPQVLRCPYCNTPYAGAMVEGRLPVCTQCGREFLPVVDDQAAVIIGGDPPAEQQGEMDEAEDNSENELNALRIEQIATDRKAAVRQRSFMIGGTVLCVVIAVQVILSGLNGRLLPMQRIAYFLFAGLLFMVAVSLMVKAREIKKELARPLLQDPKEPPDFSTLRDGTQFKDNFENIR